MLHHRQGRDDSGSSALRAELEQQLRVAEVVKLKCIFKGKAARKTRVGYAQHVFHLGPIAAENNTHADARSAVTQRVVMPAALHVLPGRAVGLCNNGV
jgi:hypothetical protein